MKKKKNDTVTLHFREQYLSKILTLRVQIFSQFSSEM